MAAPEGFININKRGGLVVQEIYSNNPKFKSYKRDIGKRLIPKPFFKPLPRSKSALVHLCVLWQKVFVDWFLIHMAAHYNTLFCTFFFSLHINILISTYKELSHSLFTNTQYSIQQLNYNYVTNLLCTGI